jgi:hypothetical protein
MLSLFQMLGLEAIPLVVITFLWLQNFAGGGNYAAKKGNDPGTKDHLSESSALSSEVQGTPGIVVLYSKHSTKVDFVTDKHGKTFEYKFTVNIIIAT